MNASNNELRDVRDSQIERYGVTSLRRDNVRMQARYDLIKEISERLRAEEAYLNDYEEGQ